MSEILILQNEQTAVMQSLNKGWEFSKEGDEKWMPAEIPGCVHLDLQRNKAIEDPFYRDNESRLKWIADSDWVYALTFTIDDTLLSQKHLELVFDGLDTYATITLNGENIAETNNMFHPWRIDVKNIVKKGENLLQVYFHSVLAREAELSKGRKQLYPSGNDQANGTSTFTRKAPYNYGWDWGPCLITAGIWQDVRLEAWNDFKILNMTVVQDSLNAKQATLTAVLNIQSEQAQEVAIDANIDANQVSNTRLQLAAGENDIRVPLTIQNPQRWWPLGYGEQHRYNISITLNTENDTQKAEKKIGLRTVELRREKDTAGESFGFYINDVPVFCKGANWIPADSFPNRLDEAWYRDLLESAVDANMNCLRVWGGGIYENEIFYEICDELGILVWQDFMFACSLYPAHQSFLDSVEREARFQMRRLHHHPSIILWCGNNEIEAGWKNWGWKDEYPASFWDEYLALFHDLLPMVCLEEDGSRAYWPSSPASSENAVGNPDSMNAGDDHYWGVWHAKEPFESYQGRTSRFMSEYGFQSFPEPATVNSYTLPEDHDIMSPVMQAHQRSAPGNALIKSYMENYYRIPEDFQRFLILSQVLQAHGIKIGAEHFRRLMPHCMGSLYWQLNDCWPVASWASIDYFGRWKALQYAAKRFYSMLMISPVQADSGNVEIYIVSDLQENKTADLHLSWYDFHGKQLYQSTEPVIIDPLSSRIYSIFSTSDTVFDGDSEQTVLYCTLQSDGKLLANNAYYFTHAVNQKLAKPEVDLTIKKNGNNFNVSVKSTLPVRDFSLSASELDGRFSDNFFDIMPGVPRETTFQSADDISEEKFRSVLQWQSLYELMELG